MDNHSDRKLKVVFLLGSLNRGGTETLLLDMFKTNTLPLFESFCIYRKQGILENEFINTDAHVLKISTGKNPFNYILKLRNFICENEIQIIHAQQYIDAFYAYVAAIGLKTKLVQTFHGYDFSISGFGKFILKFIIRKTQANFYVSNSTMEYYTQKYKLDSKLQQVAYNGISFDKFQNKSITTDIRKELNINDNIKLLGTVGSFVPVRDQLTICKFLKLLKDTGEEFHFIFVGKKSDVYADQYDKCVRFCEVNKLASNVSFLGVRNDVPEILKQLDAFVYSTDHDTFGIAVVEAINAGIPVFVNDWPVMMEVTDSGKLAIIYQTQNENDLLVKFSDYLNNRKLYENNAEMNAIKIRQKFNIQQHIDRLYYLYKTI